MAGISRAILEAGYGLDSLVQQLQGIDSTDPTQWPGPLGFEFAASVNQVRAQGDMPAKYVYWLQPFEVVFIKSLWGEASGDDSDEGALGQVDEEVAKSLSLVMENLYSIFTSKARRRVGHAATPELVMLDSN